MQEALGAKELNNQLGQNKQNQLDLFAAWKKDTEQTTLTVNNVQHKLSYLSYSQISTFQLCPLHYKLRYIFKLPSPVSSAQTFGTVIHTTLKDYYKLLIQGEQWSEDRLIEILRQNWSTLGFSNKAEADASRKAAQEYLLAFHVQESRQEFRTKVVEEKFIFPLAHGLKLLGIIDRIDAHDDGKIEIIDYKTSEKIPTQKQIDTDLQLTIYALAATEVRHPFLLRQPADIILSHYYLAQQQKITTTRTTQDLISAKEAIVKIAREIERSDFSCSGSTWCTKCEYKLYCNTV